MSSVSSVDSTGTTTSDTTSTTSTAESTLDYDDFLNLLTVQLENQDPFNPLSDTDFIAQMANFSTLEEVSNFSDNFSTFSSRQQQLSSAQTFLGKSVTVEPSDSDAVTGTVTAVTYDTSGGIYVTIDGSQYSADDITSTTSSSSN
jgi:flagellar basal-body rod modification protein FlgD